MLSKPVCKLTQFSFIKGDENVANIDNDTFKNVNLILMFIIQLNIDIMSPIESQISRKPETV